MFRIAIVKYVAEMFVDRVAASKVYNGVSYTDADPIKYYLKGKKYIQIHPETGELLEYLLRMLEKKGEKETFSYIKKELLHK